MLKNLRRKCQESRFDLDVNVALIFLGCAIDLLNVSSMISLIDDLSKTYHISYTTASWSLTSYAVTFAGFIAFMGRLGDIVGNSRLFTISCGCFAILSLLCALMPSFEAFAVMRALQGIAAAGLVPCGYALIPILSPPEHVQKYFSIVSCGFSSTIGIGLIIGGAFAATKIGYKGIFYLTFGAMTLICLTAFFFTCDVEKTKSKETQSAEPTVTVASLDFIGSLIFIAGSILIVVGLTEGGESWRKPAAYVTLIVGLILFFGFFAWNCLYAKIVRGFRHVGVDTSRYFEKVQLLVPLNILMMRKFIPIVLAFALNNACLFSSIYIIDQYSQYEDKNSPLLAGVKLVPLIVSMVIGNALCIFKYTKMRTQFGVAVGFFFALSGSIVLTQMHAVKKDVFWKIFFTAEVLVGFGVAVFYPYALQLAVGKAPEESKGIASGVAQTFGQLGIEIAFSVMASVLGNIEEIKGRPDASESFRKGFQNCTYFTVAVGGFGFVLTALCLVNLRTMTLEIGTEDELEIVETMETKKSCDKGASLGSF